jgi:repressor LexA
MEQKITKRQKELLEIIYQYIKDTGYPPTFEDMRENLGVSSNQSIIDLLEKLKKYNLIKREESAARGISILPLGYKFISKPPLVASLGATSAGAFVEAEEISGEWQPIPSQATQLVAQPKDNLFLLRVYGDSMINAGIDDGDVVLIRSQKEFASGDVVLAYNQGEATIKRFISDDKPPFIYLKPENPEYENILFTEQTELKGKVMSVLKNNYWKAIK